MAYNRYMSYSDKEFYTDTEIGAALNSISSTLNSYKFTNATLPQLSSTSLSGYAPINNPVFTGNPSGPTPTSSDNSTSFATTAFVKNAIGTSQVTSFSGGSTGLTNIASNGAVTLGGTLSVENGGTGLATATGYLYGNGTGAMTATSKIPTTDLSGSITNAQLANNSITIGSASATALGGTTSLDSLLGVSTNGILMRSNLNTVNSATTIPTSMLAGTVSNAQLTNNNITVGNNGPTALGGFAYTDNILGVASNGYLSRTGTNIYSVSSTIPTSVLSGTIAVANGGTGVTTSTGTGSVVLSAGPAFTGVPTAPTAASGTNTTQLATTAFVAQATSNVASSNVQTLIQSSAGNGGVANSAGLNIVGYDSSLGSSYINFWSSNSTNNALVRMGYTGNGLGWVFEVGTGAVVASVTSTGFNVNSVKSFASTDLTLTGQSGYVNMVCGSTTVAIFVNTGAVGLAIDNIRNLSGTNLTLNANGSGTLNIQCSGTQYYAFTAAALTLAGTGQGIYCDRYIGLNGAARQIMTSSSSAQYTALYNTNMANCVYTGAGWNTGGYHLFTAGTPSNSCYALAAYHNGSYGGIISLSPGVAWSTLELEGGQINVFCYGGLAVYTTGGAWVTASDQRVKTNIKPLKTDKSLQRVLQAQTMTYNKIHKDPIAPDSVRKVPHVGVIAQQVKTSNPHCISTWNNEGTEMYGVNYQDYTIHLIGAVQEQQKIITNQQSQIDALTFQMNSLMKQVATLNYLSQQK